ncbi:MAG: GcvT family protein, partial [Alphaproteobacteria bacterium]
MSIPKQAQVVIIGGGVVGCSVAYHLAKKGWKDVVLLERKQLSCGTTWHAAGLLGQLRATPNMTSLGLYTTELYKSLQDEVDQDVGLKQNGSILIARDDERWEEVRRTTAMGEYAGLNPELLTPQQVQDKYPLLNPDLLVGGAFFPGDGQCNPADVTQGLAKGARLHGAQIIEGVKVTAIHQSDAQITGVTAVKDGTDEPIEISAKHVINCGGLWGREVGKLVGVDVPLQACEHFYIITEPDDRIPRNAPVLRDPGACAYYKEDAGKILLGAFEPVSKPWGYDGIPEDFCFDELPPDFDHFEPILERAVELVPLLNEVGIHTFFNGPESFTPDDNYLLGPAPFLKGFWNACGFNSIGIQSAGGAGKILADWMTDDIPPFDVGLVDNRRMQPFQGNKNYLVERSTETLGLLYAMHWPYYQPKTSRGLRRSPIHQRLEENNACFGVVAGWERPNWFAPEGVELKYEYSYKRQNWFDYAAAEHKAVREDVAMFDISTFAKFRVEGKDAEKCLQYICASDVGVEPGKVVYTHWLNARGGIEADLTVTRLSKTEYMVVTAPAQATKDFAWLKKNIPADAHCIATDVTTTEAVLAVMGPNSRKLLQGLTETDLSNDNFPFGTVQTIELGMAKVRAQRITYVGELGWELYVPSEFAVHIFDVLREAKPDLKLAGMHVLDSCRIEKGYRHYGHDMSSEETLNQAGLGFAAKPDASDFIGRDAFLAEKAQMKEDGGLKYRLVQFQLNDPEPLVYHNEPVYRDGKACGYVVSGNYGHHLGGAIAMAYVKADEVITQVMLDASKFEIDVAGEKFEAK